MSNQEKDTVSKFDMTREVSSHYFKSSFARSMFSNSNQSKSLDFVYFDNSTIDEENENDSKTPTDDINISFNKPPASPLKRGYTAKGFDHKYEPDFLKTSSRNQNNNAITFWKRKQQESAVSLSHQPAHTDDELATLKQEVQRLVDENHRLHQTADHSVMQTQVDTLQWQLKQAESSRQMYRAVLEQVSKFLERVHKNLDQGVQVAQRAHSGVMFQPEPARLTLALHLCAQRPTSQQHLSDPGLSQLLTLQRLHLENAAQCDGGGGSREAVARGVPTPTHGAEPAGSAGAARAPTDSRLALGLRELQRQHLVCGKL